MAEQRDTYRALVAALREEFSPLALESIWIQMREHRYDTSSPGLLAQAVHDAHDVMYDTGDVADLTDVIAQAVGDPGSFLPRKKFGHHDYETVTRWSTRAVMAVLAGQRPESLHPMETVELPGGDRS